MRLVCVWVLITPLLVSAAEPLQLSLKRAVEIATSPEGNANIQLSGEAVKQAQARSGQARAALLPNLDSSISEQSSTRGGRQGAKETRRRRR